MAFNLPPQMSLEEFGAVVIIIIIITEKNEMGGACSTYEGKRSAYRIFVGRPEGRRPLGRPRRRWQDNIKMGLQDVRWGHRLE
jgi:hypothetical protein